MVLSGKSFEMGGGEQPGVSLVLQGAGSGDPAVRVGVLGAVRRDDVVDVGIPRGVSKAEHWEVGKVADRQDLGDTRNGRGPKGGGDEVGGGVHWSTAGNGGTVGGPTPTLGGLCDGNRLRGEGVGSKGRGVGR